MRTITKEVKIYDYSELDERAREKVKNDYMENLDSSIFTEQVIEDLKEATGNDVQFILIDSEGNPIE